jgi:hypothetical protein
VRVDVVSACSETWTLSAAQLAGLNRQILAAWERIPLAAYETVRKADVRWGILPRAQVPALGQTARVTLARFDPNMRGILFYGPVLVSHPRAEIECIFFGG